MKLDAFQIARRCEPRGVHRERLELEDVEVPVTVEGDVDDSREAGEVDLADHRTRRPAGRAANDVFRRRLSRLDAIYLRRTHNEWIAPQLGDIEAAVRAPHD